MDIILSVREPKKIRFTMQVTMDLEEWLRLKEQLQPQGTYASAWPARGLLEKINDLVTQAEKHYTALSENEP